MLTAHVLKRALQARPVAPAITRQDERPRSSRVSRRGRAHGWCLLGVGWMQRCGTVCALCGRLFLYIVETVVGSMASCTPPCNGNPYAATLGRRAKKGLIVDRSRSLTVTLVETLPPASLQGSQPQSDADPEPTNPHNGDQWRTVGGVSLVLLKVQRPGTLPTRAQNGPTRATRRDHRTFCFV